MKRKPSRRYIENKKEGCVKGDWYQLLENDFKFIGIEMDENLIAATQKDQYKKEMKHLINIAAFKYFTQLKETHKKIKDLQYEKLSIQPYLVSKVFTKNEKELLYVLRSKCHRSKFNFKKFNKTI